MKAECCLSGVVTGVPSGEVMPLLGDESKRPTGEIGGGAAVPTE